MVKLLRTSLGPFDINNSISIDEFTSFCKSKSISNVLVSLSDALAHMPSMSFSDAEEDRLRKGIALDCSDKNIDFSEKDEFRMLNFNGKLIGIGKVVSGISSSFKKIEIRPQKIFN